MSYWNFERILFVSVIVIQSLLVYYLVKDNRTKEELWYNGHAWGMWDHDCNLYIDKYYRDREPLRLKRLQEISKRVRTDGLDWPPHIHGVYAKEDYGLK